MNIYDKLAGWLQDQNFYNPLKRIFTSQNSIKPKNYQQTYIQLPHTIPKIQLPKVIIDRAFLLSAAIRGT